MSEISTSRQQHVPFRVSFIVPAMNESLYLAQLLDSIRCLKTSADISVLEVIVVDAESTDGTPEIASAANCVVVRARPGNVSSSRNLGASIARGNLLAFVDADCELPSDWLLTIAAEIKENVVAAGTSMATASRYGTWVERTWYQLAHRAAGSCDTQDANWLPTFNLAVRREAFECVEGFDENLTTCEDVDLGYRLASLGRLRSCGRSPVIHHGESKTVGEFFRREAWRARGTVQLMSQHRANLREFCSALLPFCVTFSSLVALSLLMVCLAGMGRPPGPSRLMLAAWGMAAASPVTLLVFRRRVKFKSVLPAIYLLSVYFLARSWGSLRAVRRVARSQPCEFSPTQFNSAHSPPEDRVPFVVPPS